MKTCNQCGYEWEPRLAGRNPVACPACKRYDWSEAKKGVKNGNGRVHEPDAGAKAGGKGKRAAVPVLRKSKGEPFGLHPMQSVRTELDERRGHQPESASEQGAIPDHKGHRVYKKGAGWWCSDCGVEFGGTE